MIKSGDRSAATLAPSAIPTWIPTFAPNERASDKWDNGSPQENITTGAPASRNGISAAGSKLKTKLTANGAEVAFRTNRTCSAADSGLVQVSPSEPRAPASDTAAASSGPAMLPVGACRIGMRMPRFSQRGFIPRTGSPPQSQPPSRPKRKGRPELLQDGRAVLSYRGGT